MLSGKSIAFVGAGNMAEALIKGLIGSRKVSLEQLIVCARRPERAAAVGQRHGIRSAANAQSCVDGAEIVIRKPKIDEADATATD